MMAGEITLKSVGLGSNDKDRLLFREEVGRLKKSYAFSGPGFDISAFLSGESHPGGLSFSRGGGAGSAEFLGVIGLAVGLEDVVVWELLDVVAAVPDIGQERQPCPLMIAGAMKGLPRPGAEC